MTAHMGMLEVKGQVYGLMGGSPADLGHRASIIPTGYDDLVRVGA